MSPTNPDGASLSDFLSKLQIPQDFARRDEATNEPDVVVTLETWRRDAYVVLSDLRTHLDSRGAISLSEQAEIVAVVAAFDGEGPWVLPTTQAQALACLEHFTPPSLSLLEQVLGQHIKPIFRSSPHPKLDAATGRKLPRPAGGVHAQQDYFETQTWKAHPGVANVISWCVRHMDSAAYEKLWHLVVPPVMTLLDDYETRYKLRGVQLVSEMLQAVPPDLLRRTGVSGLLLTSLKNTLNFLQNPETAALIRTSIPTTVSLIKLTTSPGSAQQFDQLCEILGDSIIGGIWIYATREGDAIEASIDALPDIVDALGVGSVRYLKALIPQLVYPLLPAAENLSSFSFQMSSLRALVTVIRNCAPRVHKWKDAILDGVLKRWVALVDSRADDEEAKQLKAALKEVCSEVSKACPSIVEDEFARLIETDPNMFKPLVQGTISTDV